MTRLEEATQRLQAALDRLEQAAARRSADTPDTVDLQAEIATLRRENAGLRELGGSVSGRLDAAINRLQLVLEA